MTVALKIVSSSQLPEPPYPADTRVNGWRFELDVERIKRSDTWVMAQPEWRPWLLMVWMVAWDQRPAGSLPSDHQLIAAHIGMDPRIFSAHADILLRGFVPYKDGRLYHSVVVDQVLALLDRREQERERKAKWRDKKADVPRDRHGTDVGKTLQEQEQEQGVINAPIGALSPDVPSGRPRDACPHQEIIALYHKHLPANPRVRSWDGERPKLLRGRWKDHPDLDWWDGFLGYVAESKRLTGREYDRQRGPFFPTLEWLLRPRNFQLVAEGVFHR